MSDNAHCAPRIEYSAHPEFFTGGVGVGLTLRLHIFRLILKIVIKIIDRLCGLVVRVSGYRYRGLGFDSRRYQIF